MEALSTPGNSVEGEKGVQGGSGKGDRKRLMTVGSSLDVRSILAERPSYLTTFKAGLDPTRP